MSEARVRGAIAVLDEVGFLAQYELEAGKGYQRTEEGLQRRPILFRFGEECGQAFSKANVRAQAARGAPAPARRPGASPRACLGACGQRGGSDGDVGDLHVFREARPAGRSRPNGISRRKPCDHG